MDAFLAARDAALGQLADAAGESAPSETPASATYSK
jgi:hypothetical protein